MAAPTPAGFRRAFGATVVVLALLVAGFVGLTSAQGPKLSTAQVDTTGVVSRGGQTLRLFANQRVAAIRASQLTVTPAAPVTVTTAGQVISVRFTQPLRYATDYRVAIAGVTSSDDGRTSSISYGFRTASPAVYFLHRSGGAGDDQIVRTVLGKPGNSVVYSARRIQDFAVFDTSLAVVTLTASGTSDLRIIANGGAEQNITLPAVGTIDQLHADRATGRLGFTFTDASPESKYTDTLFTVDAGGTGIPAPVLGLDGKPLGALEWEFVPNSSLLLAQATDQSVVTIDLASPKQITPLGSFLDLGAVSNDGTAAVVTDIDGSLRLDLATGKTTRLPIPGGAKGAVGGTALLAPSGLVQLVSRYDRAAKRFVPSVLAAGSSASTSTALFSPLTAKGTIGSIFLSPNNQYVVVETVPNASTSVDDGYAVNGASTTIETDFIDVSSGALMKSVAGFNARW